MYDCMMYVISLCCKSYCSLAAAVVCVLAWARLWLRLGNLVIGHLVNTKVARSNQSSARYIAGNWGENKDQYYHECRSPKILDV